MVTVLKSKPGLSCLGNRLLGSTEAEGCITSNSRTFLALSVSLHPRAPAPRDGCPSSLPPASFSCPALHWPCCIAPSTLLSRASSSMPLERQLPTDEPTFQAPVDCLYTYNIHTQSLPRAMLHNSQQAESFPILLCLYQYFSHLP